MQKAPYVLREGEKHNVFLKMPKSWFGFPSVKFFGYKVTFGKREMDEDRKKAILEFKMPSCQKEMQSFWGRRFSLSLSSLTIRILLPN